MYVRPESSDTSECGWVEFMRDMMCGSIQGSFFIKWTGHKCYIQCYSKTTILKPQADWRDKKHQQLAGREEEEEE